MGFRFHRSIKLLPGIRLNFGKRGVSASIGVRGAHVTYGPRGTRTTVGLPGTGLSYTHLEKSHHALPVPTAAKAPADAVATPASARRGFLWIGLIVVVLVIGVGRLANLTSPPQASTPPQTIPQTAAQAAAQTAVQQEAAQAKSATLGVAQIRHTVANSGTLTLYHVIAMPDGVTCYQVHLQNSRGVTYSRTAVLDDTVLSASGSAGFAGLWNRLCAHGGGRDITSDVENVVHLSVK